MHRTFTFSDIVHRNNFFQRNFHWTLCHSQDTKPVITDRNEVFTRVCDFVNSGECLPQCMLGYQHPLKQTPPGSRHPPGADTPPGAHPPPRSRHTPPEADSPPLHPPPGADSPPPPPRGSRLRDTVNEQPVRILLECILVSVICQPLLGDDLQ